MIPKIEIGKSYRKSDWDSCVIIPFDVGTQSFWGELRDIRKNLMIDPARVEALDDEWEPVLCVEDLI